jgi:type I restriction enzyme M protein
LKNSSARLLPINTILFSSRATVGSISIAKTPTCTNQGYKNFICNVDKIHFEYLYYILKKEVKNIELLASGMTYLEISKTQLLEYKIPVPPLETQNQIIAQIAAIEAQKQTIEAFLSAAPAQKEAVLKRYL